MPLPKENRCANCGFLAVRHFETRQLLDAEQTYRESGTIPWVKLDQRTDVPAYDEYPICFLREIIFHESLGRPCDDSRRKEALHTCQCSKHTPWRQGFTPKEHWEMIQEEARLRWQAEREEADRRFQAEQVARAEQFQAAEATKADERHKENIKLTSDVHASGQGGEWKRLLVTLLIGAVLASAGWLLRDWFEGDKAQQPIKVELELPKPQQPLTFVKQ